MKVIPHYFASLFLCFGLFSAPLLTPAVAQTQGQATSTAKDITSIPSEKAALERNKKLPDFTTLQTLVKDKSPITWIITGDSITHGCMHTHGERSYPEHWAELMRWEHRRFNDTVINTGISGDTIAKRDQRDLGILDKFENRIKRFQPQVVSINTGMNDCSDSLDKIPAFKKNLTQAITQVRKLKAIPILHIPSLIKLNDGRANNLHAYSETIREVANKEKVLLVDHEAHWNRFAATPEIRNKWMNDAIHPNGTGHAEMYKKMAYDLGFFDTKKPSCKLGEKTL